MKIQFVRSRLLSCVLLSMAASTAFADDLENNPVVQKTATANFQTCPKPEWPKEALKKEQTGTVTLKFFIDSDGSVVDGIVVKSSGHPLLDDAAINGIKKCRFSPGLYEGKPRPSSMTMQYVWTLGNSAEIAAINQDIARYREAATEGDAGASYKLATAYGRLGRPEHRQTILTLYRGAAAKDHPAATAELANAYRYGNGVTKDLAEANKLRRRAAELGHDASQFALAKALQFGTDGEPRVPVLAAAWFHKAADQGHPQAQNSLGAMYFHGEGVPKDRAEAVKWYRLSVVGGYDVAQRNLGQCLLNGYGVERDPKEAAVWLRKAADQRDAEAERELALMYFGGRGVEADNDEAFKLLRRSAQAFDSRAMVLLGFLTSNGIRTQQDHRTANELYRRAAAGGNHVGMNNIGYSYEMGYDVKQDFAAAMAWYVKAAALGNGNAKAAMGGLYENGLGVAKDLAAAVRWYKEAANQNNGEGARRLSRLYETGEGVPKDQAQAFDWLAKAAQSLDEPAMRRLAQAHEKGELGLPVNAELGKQWLKIADMRADGFGRIYYVDGFKPPAVR
jgi:TonB family protein